MAAAAALSAPPPGIAALMQAPMPASLEQYEGVEPRAWTSRGMELFKRGRLSESVAAFDRVIELAPAQKPYMWQRGLSLYYLERQGEAAMQFEIDVAVNPNDTEEAIWRWLAQVRRSRRVDALSPAAAVARARADMLKVGADARPVMRAAMALFSGEGGSAEQTDAADESAATALDVAGGKRLLLPGQQAAEVGGQHENEKEDAADQFMTAGELQEGYVRAVELPLAGHDLYAFIPLTS